MIVWYRPDRYSRRLREQGGLSPFGVEVTRQQRTPTTETDAATRAPAPPDVAERLGLRPGTEVVHRATRYLVDGEPVQLGVTYLPTHLEEATDPAPGGLFDRLEEQGWPVTLVREEVTARMPTPEEAERLAVAPGTPVLEMVHTSMDDWKRPFEVTRFVLRADRGGFAYEVPVED